MQKPHVVETISVEEFRRRRLVVKGRRAAFKPSSPRTYSKKTSQVRGHRAGGIVTIVVDERDVMP